MHLYPHHPINNMENVMSLSSISVFLSVTGRLSRLPPSHLCVKPHHCVSDPGASSGVRIRTLRGILQYERGPGSGGGETTSEAWTAKR